MCIQFLAPRWKESPISTGLVMGAITDEIPLSRRPTKVVYQARFCIGGELRVPSRSLMLRGKIMSMMRKGCGPEYDKGCSLLRYRLLTEQGRALFVKKPSSVTSFPENCIPVQGNWWFKQTGCETCIESRILLVAQLQQITAYSFYDLCSSLHILFNRL